MFSQSSIDSMSIDELVKTIKSTANEIFNRIDNGQDALDYTNAMAILTEALKDRLEEYVDDVA